MMKFPLETLPKGPLSSRGEKTKDKPRHLKHDVNSNKMGHITKE
jgi:hypothetical protein